MPEWLWFVVWVAVFLAGAALYVLRPVLAHQGSEVSALERRRSELLANRETVLTALRELDLDYAVGKLDEADYKAQRARLLQEGAAILRALDEVEAQLQAEPVADASQADLDARVEALLAQRRAEQAHRAVTEQGRAAAQPGPESLDDTLEALLLARRKQRKARFAGFCPHCGAPYLPNDRFCGKCGQPLGDSPAAAHRKRRARAKR